ncbi:MAG: hypothetical protein N838_25180 [Thiohalocapsa sp. PB-PSB1]|nr:MAG: hypothetical protein N838_25180 [Thiohalocapsa sp. PB-PSB1]
MRINESLSVIKVKSLVTGKEVTQDIRSLARLDAQKHEIDV